MASNVYIIDHMLKRLLILFTLLFSHLTLANEELLSILNSVEYNEKLIQKSMGTTAKASLAQSLKKLQDIPTNELSDFHKNFKNTLMERISKLLDNDSETLSSCEFIHNKHHKELTTLLDKPLHTREDFLKNWQSLKLVKLEIEINKACPNLKELWGLVDDVNKELLQKI